MRRQQATVRQMRRARRLYVFLARHDITEGKADAVLTYALRMQKLGLLSNKTAKIDAQSTVLRYYALAMGYKRVHEWLKAINDKLGNWRN